MTATPVVRPVWMRHTLNFVRAHPVALSFALMVLIAGLVSGSLLGGAWLPIGVSPVATIQQGQWWTILTALVVPDSWIEVVLTALLAVTVLAYAEHLLGTRRTIAAMAGFGVLTLTLGVFVHAGLWAIVGLEPFEPAETPVLDPAIGLWAAVMFASAIAPALWRRRLRLIGFATLAMFALYAGDGDAWYRLGAALLGLVAGSLFLRRGEGHAWHPSSVHETRSLIAVLVAVTGAGPLAALVAGGGRGPLSIVVGMFAQYDEHLVHACETRYFTACDHVTAAVVTHGLGPTLLAIVPLVLLLLAAWGLWNGRRAGWLLALVVNAVIAAFSFATLVIGVDSRIFAGDAIEIAASIVAELIVPLAMIAVLVVTRRRFPIRARRVAAAIASSVTVFALVAGMLLYVLVAAVFHGDFSSAPRLADDLVEAIRRFIPPAFLEGIGQPPYPRGGAALWAYQWVGVVFWIIACFQIVRLYRSPEYPLDSDGTLYRALLRRGGGTLGFLGTWEGTRYWYSADQQSAVAYRLVGDVALALADPVGDVARQRTAILGFVALCAQRGWTPAFYSIHEELLPIFDSMGWEHFSVGEETVVDLPEFDLVGKAREKIRQPVTRAEREGMHTEWGSWRELSAALTVQIEEISEAWVAEKALPEMGFTLGGIAEARDPEVRLLLAIDADGRVQGVTSWMPSWTDGVQTGWTLDFMRRAADGPNGVMEFLIAKAALRMRDEGIAVMSLSGAPLATRPGDDTEPEPIDDLLAWLGTALEPVYGFSSLFRFKSKFKPRYVGIHLAYADPVALPRIGTAIGRAYLPEASTRDMFALAREMWGGRR